MLLTHLSNFKISTPLIQLALYIIKLSCCCFFPYNSKVKIVALFTIISVSAVTIGQYWQIGILRRAFLVRIADCGAPASIDNGLVEYNTTTYRGVAEISCVTGFNLVGKHVISCLSNSTWEYTSVYCEVIGTGIHVFNSVYNTRACCF